MRLCYLFSIIFLLFGCSRAQLVQVTKQDNSQQTDSLVSIPNISTYSDEGFNLIINEETGGQSVYNKWPYPEWPEGDSGITAGIGYDFSTVSVDKIYSDWTALNKSNLDRLAAIQPYSGSAAKSKLNQVQDILFTWPVSINEFRTIDLVRFYLLTKETFPGFDNLDPRCQFALISLVYNRGNSMVGSGRIEMREIRTLVSSSIIDYKAIADQFRQMVRIWKGTSIETDMTNRRNHEANLVMECIQ